MRILGLDVGDRRIGVALSDELALFAQGLFVLERRSLAADMAALRQAISEHGVTRLVVGMPRNMNGSYGPQADKTAAFIEHLERSCACPVSPGTNASPPSRPSACCSPPTSGAANARPCATSSPRN